MNGVEHIEVRERRRALRLRFSPSLLMKNVSGDPIDPTVTTQGSFGKRSCGVRRVVPKERRQGEKTYALMSQLRWCSHQLARPCSGLVAWLESCRQMSWNEADLEPVEKAQKECRVPGEVTMKR